MDKLDKFIHKHRSEFDSEKPSKRLWLDIQREVQAPKAARRKINWISSLAIAASILGVLFAGWYAFDLSGDTSEDVLAYDPIVISIDPNYAAQVKSINQQIMAKQVELQSLAQTHPELNEKIITNMESLNKSYEDLRQNLLNSDNKEILLDAMIENLNLQITILSRQLSLIQQLKNEPKDEINI